MNRNVLLTVLCLFLNQCTELPQKTEKIGRIDALILYYSQCDGAGCYAAADLLFEELVGSPLDWYEAMAKDSVSFNRFLNAVEHRIFELKSPFISLEDLESRRTQVLDRLKRKKVFPEYEEMHNRVIKTLEDMKLDSIQ